MKKKYSGIVEDRCMKCPFHIWVRDKNRLRNILKCTKTKGHKDIPSQSCIPSWCPLEDAEEIDYDEVLTIREIRNLLSAMYENLPANDEELVKVVKAQIKEDKKITREKLTEAIKEFKKELRMLGMDKMTVSKYEIQVHHILSKTISELIKPKG